MNWPSDDDISAMLELPEGYRGERLKRSDVPALAAAIALWHPDISVGAASCYLREDFFIDKAFIDGETQKDLLVIVIKRGDEFSGMGSWEREQDALAVYARFGAIAPQHRGANFYAKVLVPDEDLLRPDPRNLSPRAKVLFDVLFPN